MEELPESSGPALAALLEFRDREFRVWSTLRDRLVGMGADALPALRVFLKELDWETRAFAAACIGEIGDRSLAVDVADAYAVETYVEARRQCVLALATLAAPTSRETLLAAAGEEDPGVRLAGVRGLGRLGAADLAGVLRRFTGDPELDIRYEARGALAELGDKETVEALLEEARAMVGDRKARRANSEPLEDNEVRYSQYLLGLALARTTGNRTVDKVLVDVLTAAKPWGHRGFFRMGAAEGLGRRAARGGAVNPALLKGITHSETSVRVACTYAALYVRSPELVPRLRAALGDSQLDVRHNATMALGTIGTVEAVAALRRALKDSAGEVRIAAVRALADTALPAATKLLVTGLRDSKYMIRVQAARALAHRAAEPGVVEGLVRATRDPDYGVRAQALASLAHHPDATEVLDPVVACLSDRDAGVRSSALLALAALAGSGPVDADEDAATQGVSLYLGASRERLMRAALEYLDAVRPPAAVPPLLDALGNDSREVRRRANLALQKMSETTRGFDPDGSQTERSASERRWRQWWEESGGRLPPRGARSRMVATGDFVDTARDLKWKGLDIAILFDSTYSMAALTSAVKERIDEIIRQLRILLPSLRVSVYTYRDDTDDYIYYGSPLTYDTWKLTGFLQNAIHGQGRDLPEAVYEVVKNVTENLRWRPGAHKVVVYAGDAPHHSEYEQAFLKVIKGFFTKENQAVLHAVFTDTHRRSLDIGARTKRYDPSNFRSTFWDAFKRTAEAGRGRAVLLDDESALIKELLVMTFGEPWRAEIENLLDFEM
jgi:HEAT repeat protein